MDSFTGLSALETVETYGTSWVWNATANTLKEFVNGYYGENFGSSTKFDRFGNSRAQLKIKFDDGSVVNVKISSPYELEITGSGILEDGIFENNTNLKKITINGYSAIGSEAFHGCKKLTDVTLSPSVKTIGYRAFAGCDKLKNMKISNGTEKIEPMAFANDFTMQSIELPDSITTIGYGALQNCDRLESVRLSNNIKEIGKDTFLGCYSLSSINGSEKRTNTVGFRLMADDKVINIPSSVEKLGNTAFKDCTGMSKVFIPSSVRSIEKNTFEGISSGTVFTVEQGSYAEAWLNSNGYSKRYAYTGGELPNAKGVTHTIKGMKYIISGKRTVNFAGVVKSNVTKITIPATVKIGGQTYKVTSVAANAFKNNKRITKVTIGKNVKTIGTGAFRNAAKLKTVTIPSNVKTVGASAFRGCTSLTKAVVGRNVKTIGKSAFYGCSRLSRVTVGRSVETIGDYAFYGNKRLKTVSLPASVKSIGKSAFRGCTALTKITLGRNVTKIGTAAFYGDKKLKTIVISSAKLKSVGRQAFKGIYTKAVVKAPKSRLSAYKKLLKRAGLPKKAKVIK